MRAEQERLAEKTRVPPEKRSAKGFYLKKGYFSGVYRFLEHLKEKKAKTGLVPSAILSKFFLFYSIKNVLFFLEANKDHNFVRRFPKLPE
jgi:hypothetical protein